MNNKTKIILVILMITTVTTVSAYTLMEPSIFDFITVGQDFFVKLQVGNNSLPQNNNMSFIKVIGKNLSASIELSTVNKASAESVFLKLTETNISISSPYIHGIPILQPICVTVGGNLTASCGGKTGTYNIRMADNTNKTFVFTKGLLISVT